MNQKSIERIEVLEGSAARILGPGAFTGAINFVTRQRTGFGLSASQVFGAYSYNRTQLDAMARTGSIGHCFSLSRSASSGYAHNTDHKLQQMYYRASLQRDGTMVDWQMV